MAYQRDPVSELFDEGAARLLARARRNRGRWAGTRLANPSPRHEAWAAAHGINLHQRDTVTGGEARTRWARGFVRALYYAHKHQPSASGGTRVIARGSGALMVEVGRALPGGRQAGTLLVPGRAVRVKLVSGGAASDKAVSRMPDSRKWADQGPRWADPAGRDWA